MISPGLHGGSDYVPGAAALREVGRIVGALVAEGAAPGVAYGIVTRAGLAHAGGAGVVAAGGGRPGAGSGFRVASMSTSFTAAAVRLLQEQGRLAIHAPV
ncbi:MAG: beta-lactamase family protein, partial [Opitutaceae bacterium]|nr:beta-lactamase family protein [Opitutaceae bacterium]